MTQTITKLQLGRPRLQLKAQLRFPTVAPVGPQGIQGDPGPTGPAAWIPPAAWVTAAAYVAGPPASVVVQAGETYVCLVPHTSGTFATDLAAAKWIKVAQKGSGDLLSTNNLSDVTSKAASFDNLTVHGANVASAATLNLDTATGYMVNITGSTGITAIILADGRRRVTRFLAACTVTAGASIVLPFGMTSYAFASGDMVEWASYGGTATAVSFIPAAVGSMRGAIGVGAENALQANPGSPTGTASASPIMMGLGATCKLTPAFGGRVRVEFSGVITAAAVLTGTVQLRYGTGTAPSNSAAAVGTQAGASISGTVAGASYTVPFTVSAILTGLTQGTQVWFDLALSTGGGATVSINNINFNGFEL